MFRCPSPLVERYAELLAGAGTERGLLGPRETPPVGAAPAQLRDGDRPHPRRIHRHRRGQRCRPSRSGAALRRPDLTVTLLEPLLRRTRFLDEAVDELGLGDQVEVLRGRAEQVRGTRSFDVVTSRAVAPLVRLLPWSLPLARRGGLVLALKGSTADDELATAAQSLATLGGTAPEVVHIGSDSLTFPTTVVRVEAGRDPPLGSTADAERSRRAGARRGPDRVPDVVLVGKGARLVGSSVPGS